MATTPEPLYRLEPYVAKFEARITAIRDDGVELDRTAFYPRGGGQHGDVGLLGGVPIVDTTYDGDAVVHRFEGTPEWSVGQEVAGAVDWDRRYRTMRLHTAQHLAFVAGTRAWGDRESTGGDINDLRARIDMERFAGEESLAAEPLLEEFAALLAADEEVETFVDPESHATWLWQVAGRYTMPCGGTHVRTTGEVGLVRLEVKRRGAANSRIIVTLDDAPG